MISLESILENETLKSILSKAGVSPAQAKGVATQALGSIKNNHDANPSQMASLLSDNPNTPEDESLKQKVENDFLSNLIKKVGLPESVANQVKGALPGVMGMVSSKLSAGGANNAQGIQGMMGSLGSLFDNDADKDGKPDKGGFFAKLMAMFTGKK